MSTRGTLDLIAHHLVRALQPLEDAFSDADSFRVLMLQLGWDAPGLPPSYLAVADKVAQATAALDALEDGATAAEVFSVIDKAGAVYKAMKALAEAPEGIDAAAFLPELAQRLFEYLLGRQLISEAPSIYSTFEALGIIALEDQPATSARPGFSRFRFDWDQIPAVLSKPSLIPERVYGWGTPHLNFPKIAELLTEVAIGIGLPASLDKLSEEFAGVLQAQATGPPIGVVRLGMTIALFEVSLSSGETEVIGLMVTELPAEGTALPGIVLLPKVPNGIAERVDLGGGWTFSVRAGTDLVTQLGVVFRPDGVSARYPGAPGQTLPSAGFGVALRYEGDTPLIVFGQTGETRLELVSSELTGAADIKAGNLELKIGIATKGMALVIEPGGADSFLGEILGDKPLRIEMGTSLGWSSRTGLSFMAEGGFGITVQPNVKVGGIRFERVDLGVRFADGPPPSLKIQAAASFSAAIGPIAFSVDQFGVQLPVKFTDGNVGPFDIGFALKPPNGVGVAVAASLVTGGGFLSFDSQKHEYSGVLQLEIAEKISVKAIGLLSTRLPDGRKGYSLILIIFVEGFTPIQLGFGFALTGIGGLVAINRSFDEEALRSGLKNHTLDSVMFPRDPIRNAPQIISNLNRVFPPAPGHHLFGPMVQLSWGTPTLISAEVGVVLELGARLRLLILAQIAAILPNRENDLVRLQMDAIGVLDFDQGTATLDASLYDSRLLKKFVLTGDMALRLKWEGTPHFALSVGGLHPAFQPPPNFPKLERIAINLSSGDNPRLRCESYFAITSNTVQFGARAELLAAAAGFSIHGEIGYDVLIQFDPFFFVAEFHAQLQLKRGSTNLFKVKVEGSLAGPRPLHLKGKATFEILWWDVTIRVDVKLVKGERPPAPAPIEVLPRLQEALRHPDNWVTRLPVGQRPVVTLTTRAESTEILLHPLGTLEVKEAVVPLNLEISKFGQAAPAGARRFTITSVNIGGDEQSIKHVRDFFAPAQFIELREDEKLSRPSFEQMDAGVTFMSDAIVFTTERSDWLETKAIEFETWILEKGTNVTESADEKDGQGVRQFYTLSELHLNRQARFGAAGRSELRQTGKARYRTTLAKHKLAKEGWTIVDREDLTPQPLSGVEEGRPASYSEAVQELRRLKQEAPASAGRLKILRPSELANA